MWSAPAPPVNYGSNSGSGVFGGSLYGQAAGESEGSVTTASPISHGSVGSTGNTHQALVAPESLPSLPTSSNNPSGVTSTSSTHHQTKPSSHSNLNNGGAAGRTRRRKWTMEERQEHSVLEKKRREEFNVLLLDLARKLPNLSGRKNLNKRVVVQGALEHVDAEQQLLLAVLPDVRALVEERDALLQEVNDWRTRVGMEQQTKRVDPTQNLEQLQRVEAYMYGSFAGGFTGGDNNEGEDQPPQTSSKAGEGRLPNGPNRQSSASSTSPPTKQQSSQQSTSATAVGHAPTVSSAPDSTTKSLATNSGTVQSTSQSQGGAFQGTDAQKEGFAYEQYLNTSPFSGPSPVPATFINNGIQPQQYLNNMSLQTYMPEQGQYNLLESIYNQNQAPQGPGSDALSPISAFLQSHFPLQPQQNMGAFPASAFQSPPEYGYDIYGRPTTQGTYQT